MYNSPIPHQRLDHIKRGAWKTLLPSRLHFSFTVQLQYQPLPDLTPRKWWCLHLYTWSIRDVVEGLGSDGWSVLPLVLWPKTGLNWMAHASAQITEEGLHADGWPLALAVVFAAGGPVTPFSSPPVPLVLSGQGSSVLHSTHSLLHCLD